MIGLFDLVIIWLMFVAFFTFAEVLFGVIVLTIGLIKNRDKLQLKFFPVLFLYLSLLNPLNVRPTITNFANYVDSL